MTSRLGQSAFYLARYLTLALGLGLACWAGYELWQVEPPVQPGKASVAAFRKDGATVALPAPEAQRAFLAGEIGLNGPVAVVDEHTGEIGTVEPTELSEALRSKRYSLVNRSDFTTAINKRRERQRHELLWLVAVAFGLLLVATVGLSSLRKWLTWIRTGE